MRKPFKKNIQDIPIESAHGGSGKRQLILSKDDFISSHLHAMTKGFLAPKAVFDWHSHDNIDEFFLVLRGTGIIRFKDGSEMQYLEGDLIYIPSKIEHQIEAKEGKENQFFFIRLDS